MPQLDSGKASFKQVQTTILMSHGYANHKNTRFVMNEIRIILYGIKSNCDVHWTILEVYS